MYDQFMGLGEEVTVGTLVARTEFHRCYPGSIITPQYPREDVTYLGRADPEDTYDMPQSADFKMIVPMVTDLMEVLLKHCFGEESKSGTGPYDRTYLLSESPYTRAASPLVGLSVEGHWDMPDSGFESMLLDGGRVTEFGSNFAVGEEIKWDVDGVGIEAPEGPKTASPTFPTYDSYKVVPAQVTVEIDDAVTNVYGFDFRANKNLRTDRAFLGSATIAPALTAAGKRSITGTIAKEWDARTLYGKFRSGATAKLEVIGTIDASHNFTLTFPKVQFTGDAPEPTEGEFMEYQLGWKALRDATDGMVKLELTNMVA